MARIKAGAHPLPLCMPIDLPAFFALFTPMFLRTCFYAEAIFFSKYKTEKSAGSNT